MRDDNNNDLPPFFISRKSWKKIDKPTKKEIRKLSNVKFITKIVVHHKEESQNEKSSEN